MTHIVSRILNFTDLSESEKDSLESLTREVISVIGVDHLSKAISVVRNNEGKVFRGVVARYKQVIKPLSGATEGVYVPLDSRLNPKGREIEIFVPERLESYADSGLIQDLIRYSSEIEGVQLSRIKGDMTVPEKKGELFFMGYITELLSDQKIERISYSKDSSYQTGRMCARTKLLLGSLDPKKTPTKYLRIPERYLGGTNQFKESELTRSIRTYFAASDYEIVSRLLNNLCSHVLNVRGAQVKGKLGENLLIPHSEFLHAFKRKTTRTEHSKRGKPVTRLETIDPTKPSQLATVAPWERPAVSEFFELAWRQESDLIQEYNSTPGFERDYKCLGERISKIFNDQWKSKQKVLRLSKHRLAGYPHNKEDPLFKKLNWIRETLTKVATMDGIPALERVDFDPLTTWGAEKFTAPDGFTSSLETLYKESSLGKYFSEMEKLFSIWEEKFTRLGDSYESQDGSEP